MSENLNEVFTVSFDDANVITVPIDDTLSKSGEAADAKAVGDALAQKADLNQIVSISVNGESPDNQGAILIDGGDIPLSDASGAPTVKAAVETIQGWDAADIPADKTQQGGPSIQASLQALAGRTAATIPMSSAQGADMISAKIAAMENTDQSLAEAIGTVGSRTVADIAMDSDDPTKVKAAIEGRVKSVNGLTGDEDGNVQVDEVPFADNLRSQYGQNVIGTFTNRTTGGEASVGNGDAWLTEIRGNRVHTGYVPETLNMTVTLVPREEGEDTLTAVLDEDTFKEEVTASAVITLTYTTEWSANPATYGITLTGTPKNGDQIVVVYVAETRGTITQSAPTGFVSTGWNLYNHTAGYAKVIKYSTMYGFCIEGTYTSLAFSATLDGAQSTITPAGGYFNVPSNGYVWVTGGTSTDTEIYMTWGDWIDSEDHPDFAAYSETTIDLSTIMSTYFPYGLLRVGDIRDEISLNVGVAISRVERLNYNAVNLATAKASGREYEYDTEYIYLERLTPVTSEISLDGGYTADDHGIEYFNGTITPVYAITLYGQNLKNKLERDVVTKSGDLVNSLTSTSTEKALTAAQGKALKDITDTLNSNFSPTTFSPVTVPHGSVESGGYIKIGKIVILQVRIRTTEATVEFITGLPKPLNALSTPSAGVVCVAENISINGSGTVVSGSSLSAGVYQFAVIYVCK